MRAILRGLTGPSPGILSFGVLFVAGCSTIKDYDEKPEDLPPPPTATQTNLPAPVDCDAYEFEVANGQYDTFNCSSLDRCDLSPENILFRTACCDCDPALCQADASCPGYEPPPPPPGQVETCMSCHNGSTANDYAGPGQENPHPFTGASNITCTGCHGGNPQGLGKVGSHVPTPPQIGSREYRTVDATAYFNYLTLAGVDKFPDYEVDGVTYSAMDYLQFINPGDIRATETGRGCGNSGCHEDKSASFARSFIGNEQGFYSKTAFTVGDEHKIPEAANYYGGTGTEMGFRAQTDPNFVYDPLVVGPMPRVVEVPEYARWNDTSGFYQNQIYDANTIANFRYAANNGDEFVNQVIPNSPLAHVVNESIVFQCGDCHAGSRGANNRYADFRSSGCTVCHMNYSKDGRSRSRDINVPKDEPFNPDAIAAPERSHIESHQIRNVAKIMPDGTFVRGITDYACVGCHQGSNRTVLQYWGIRLDQNADVVNGFQYPANPFTFATTQNDTRLFDPAVANATFNGRNFNQYLLEEDYDNDQRDDTPPDAHYQAGMGCIDCHGERDLHGKETKILSNMDQTVQVVCESCHGTVDTVATTAPCTDYVGASRDCPTDLEGNALRNTYKDGNGDFWLVGRVDGLRHFVPQLKYMIYDSQRTHPLTGEELYNPNASYAMGRADGVANNGVGPQQQNPALVSNGFSHMDNVDCSACHAAWENNCIGCHLQLQYNANPANYFFSNTTGERIVVQVTNADFTYIQPNWFFLEVTTRGDIGAGWSGMKPYYRYVDQNNNQAAGITFSDRNGLGSNPAYGESGDFPALSHNAIAPHSIRGKQQAQYEGQKECVACHNTVDGIANYADYPNYYAQIENRDYANLDFALLQAELGLNTNNNNNSPYYVHMVTGLGTGLMAADQFGCPVNPLDNNANRIFCNNSGGAPANNFNANNIAYDWDKVVEATGASNVSLTKPFLAGAVGQGVSLRSLGAPGNAGPLSPVLVQRLADPATGIILDSWIDANGAAAGGAANFIIAN